MWTSNNALVPDPDKEDILASLPLDWPFLRLGLRMCGWGDNQIKYYLLGTPIIWYFSTISLGLGLGIAFWYIARAQRSYKDWAPGMFRSATRPLGRYNGSNKEVGADSQDNSSTSYTLAKSLWRVGHSIIVCPPSTMPMIELMDSTIPDNGSSHLFASLRTSLSFSLSPELITFTPH